MCVHVTNLYSQKTIFINNFLLVCDFGANINHTERKYLNNYNYNMQRVLNLKTNH